MQQGILLQKTTSQFYETVLFLIECNCLVISSGISFPVTEKVQQPGMFCNTVLSFSILRPHHREEQYILYGMLIGQQHGNTVDTKADAAGGRHAILKGT